MDIEKVYVGSYTADQNKPGIYQVQPSNLYSTTQVGINLVNPSYILLHNNLLYVVQETVKGRLNVIDQNFKLLKTVQTEGDSPCHIAINEKGNRIVVANYFSPTFIMYELNQGIPDKLSSLITHEGSSVHPERQACPHPHCSVFCENDSVLFVSDLGTDTVYHYRVNYQGPESLVCQKEKSLRIQGCGPRTLAKGKQGQKTLYLSGELDSSVRVISYETGSLQLLYSVIVSENPNPKNATSQIAYFNNMVFMACRGDDQIVVFNTQNPKNLIELFRIKVGSCPRHFKITKNGILYVGGQLQDQVLIFRLQNGNAVQIGSFKTQTPTCIAFEN